jgi:hypothetical protein
LARIGKRRGVRLAAFLEGVGHVLEEDQAQHDMHVVARVDVGPQLVGGGPQALVEVVEELLLLVVHGAQSGEKGQRQAVQGARQMPFD